jgi:hypothetical protein
MPNYVLPQVLVFQEFASQPVALAQPQNACIIGHQYDLHRYTDSDEKAGTKVTDVYDYTTETCYPWPGREAGAEVDFNYTKVFMEDALLRYYTSGSGGLAVVTTTNGVTPAKNRVRFASLVLKTANSFTRSGAFLRDVKVGDVLKVSGLDCSSATMEFTSTITGLVADLISSSIDATPDAYAANLASQAAAAVITQTAGTANDITEAASAASFNAYADGNASEVYTITFTLGGAPGVALFDVTTASGNDESTGNTPAAFASPTTIGTRGLTVTWSNTADDFVAGQEWTVTVTMPYTAPTVTAAGTYVGDSDTTYVVEVTRGGKFSDVLKPQITVSTTTGIDLSGPTDVTTSGVAVAIGSLGVTITFTIGGGGLYIGDKWDVAVVAAAEGAVRTVTLANNLPDDLRGFCGGIQGAAPALAPTLYIKKNIEVSENRIGSAPLVNYTQSDTEICIKDGIEATDDSWAVANVPVNLPVEAGKVFVQHRDRLSTNCNVLGSINSVGDIDSVFAPGAVVHPDNPLVFGVYNSLLNGNGEDCYYLGVCGDDLENWLDAIDILTGNEDVYSLVPLTKNKEVLDAFSAHCDSESSPFNGRWRICWINQDPTEVLDVYSKDALDQALLATISDDVNTSGTQYTIVDLAGGEFITKGVRAGDTLRALYTTDGFGNVSYSEYEIDAVLSEETLRLLTGPASPVITASKIEIHRTLTRNEIAADLAQKPGLFRSRRTFLVWPDKVGNAGMVFEGFHLCAALAGLRAASLPHQGLTNVEITGFDDLSRTVDYFSATQLNVLADSGYWIVTKDKKNGTVFTRHQLSTGDQTDLTQKEQNITTNLDNISKNFLLRIKPFIGRGNVTPTMISIIKTEIIDLVEEFKNTILVPRLGPQMLDAVIIELQQHPTLLDRIVARISVDLPFPLNNVELHLIA